MLEYIREYGGYMKKFLKILILFLFIIPLNIKAEEIDIYSENAVMFNLNNNEIIYEKNKFQR